MFRPSCLLTALLVASCAPQAPVEMPRAAVEVQSNAPAKPEVAAPSAAPAPAPVAEAPAHPASAPQVIRTTLNGISVTAVVFDSRTHRLAIADQAGGPGSQWPDAASAARSLGGVAAVNAGFFTPEGKPLGLVVTGGKKISPLNRASSLGAGLFIGGTSPALLRRGQATSSPEVLQSGPFLVENGRVVSGLSPDSSTARTVLGWDGGSGWFIARTGGCSLAGLGHALAGAEIRGVKARTVLNLDGGRSSDLWVSSTVSGGPVSERPFWNKPVRNFLVLVPR
ncbi:phosphodiester glycosidase family protein [Luteolibacter flavescens]|uniref:Phosphodiester glycosidase family protein n=1 Tax=Luteolibacter flavescens TaxID=1859460 RepID=A0ABT3FI04_9BACT|nr:phosphodiester glycosidase family protein [Luteolibacter flavescens]MCW1883185.1 phosphodiester glycosidase family protein [Luteolibacter flavescens]